MTLKHLILTLLVMPIVALYYLVMMAVIWFEGTSGSTAE